MAEPELKHYLTRKRAQIAPGSVGLNGSRRRRSEGLTREDMAELTGVSFRWYTQFESGAAKGVSRHFAERVAAALKLGAAERHYLWSLLGFVSEHQAPHPVTAPDVLHQLLHRPQALAMALYSPLFDVLDANSAYRDLFPPASTDEAFGRNKLWRMFHDEAFRATWVDWTAVARRIVGDFRLMSNPCRHSLEYRALFSDLERVPEFRMFWDSAPVSAIGAPGFAFALHRPNGTVARFAVTVLRAVEQTPAYVALLTPQT